ncbi:MAG TPA: carboxypeptidase regulatory-like domain-containing protein [Bryobacteraceae bacterium]|nr:carboxypeptidase regulatory-like domain-containing protein [Bryobacteraceae bacterium]
MHSSRKTSARIALLTIFLPVFLRAQQTGASVTGHITDPSGAAVSGAAITAKSVTTGAVFSAASDTAGVYQIPFLKPGPYAFTVVKPGFQTVSRTGITLTVAQKATLDFELKLGAVSQTVNVVADAPLVQAESGDRNWTIGSERVSAVPLRGLNTIESTWSSPGVTTVGAVTKLRPFDTAGSQQESINGGQSGQNGQTSGNLVLVDGISSNTHGVGVGYNAISDSVQEIAVQATMYDAQYGWSTGGVVNTITRGGTNEYHGDAYEYLQNTLLNANTWGNNRNGVARIPWHINMFGGSVGGPLIKNKVFAFFAYQKIRQVQPDQFVSSVPTAPMRSGDFSQVFNSSGTLQTIYDPLTTVCSGGTCTRLAFPGNMIPAGRINPVAKNVLGIIPGPNVPGNPITNLGNLANTGASRKFDDVFPEYSGRLDYNYSEGTQFAFRYSVNRLDETRGYHYSTTSGYNIAETSGNSPFSRANTDFSFQVTHTFNPTTTLQVRTGLDHFISTSGSTISRGFNVPSLGFSPTFAAEADKWFPKFVWSGYEGAGSNPEGITPSDLTYSNEAVLAKTYRGHNIKLGFQNMQIGENVVNPGYSAGYFNFTGNFTTADPLHQSSATGNSIADFLLGNPASGFIQVNSAPALMEHLWSVFVQDDIHVSSRLTINAGLRWDYLGPLSDRFNALTRGFCGSCPSPLQVPGLNLFGGLLFAGQQANPHGIYDPRYGNFGPRVGFAYRIGNDTVLRGGYGMIYGQAMDNPGAAPGFSQTTNMVTSIQTGIPFNTLTNPFPQGILTPVGSSGGLATGLGQGITFANPQMNIPRTQQFSFEIQHRFAANWLATAAYVGSRSSRLPVNQQLNYLPLSALQLGAAALTASVPNPFLGLPSTSPYASLAKGTYLSAPTVQEQQLLVPYPQFPVGGVTEQFVPIGYSNFNSLQLELVKRLSYGLDLSAAYTWQKTMQALSFNNPTDASLAYSVSPFDVPQQIKLSGVWYLPFGRGKKFRSSAGPLEDRIIGGWSVSAIGRLQQGMPLRFPSGVSPTGASPTIANANLGRWFNTCTMLANGGTTNCAAGQQPVWAVLQPFQLVTWSPYLSSVRNPGIDNLDISVAKATRIKERYNLVFRSDFLNATNTPQWFNGPDTNANSGTFGAIAGYSTPSNDPRVIMLSLRFEF